MSAKPTKNVSPLSGTRRVSNEFFVARMRCGASRGRRFCRKIMSLWLKSSLYFSLVFGIHEDEHENLEIVENILDDVLVWNFATQMFVHGKNCWKCIKWWFTKWNGIWRFFFLDFSSLRMLNDQKNCCLIVFFCSFECEIVVVCSSCLV